MGLIRHNLPLFITLALVFFVLGFVVIGAFLWQRVGLVRASLFGALVLWGGLVLAFTVSPKRRYKGELALPRSCDVSVLPSHLLGALTNLQRVQTVLLFVPLSALLILAARGLHRLVLAAALVVLPFLIESVQYALPGLRRTCTSTDVYDSWTGLVVGIGVGAGLLVVTRHSRFALARDARHRHPDQRPANPLDVVRVLWPPLEEAQPKAPVTPRSTFVPSGAKPGATPAPPSARQVRRERAQQEREERRANPDRRTNPDRRGRHSKKAGPQPDPATMNGADLRGQSARRETVRRATDREPNA
jgi:hypothetical protein